MAIVLGGNIVLEGFDSEDFTELIVVKKIVGQYARKFSDDHQLVRLVVTLRAQQGISEVSVQATFPETECSAVERAHNLFVALDASLKKIVP